MFYSERAHGLVCVATLLMHMPLAAQTSSGPPAGTSSAPVLTHDANGGVIVRAARITTPIRIDGRLDEAAYREVPAIMEFIQQEPDTGAAISEKTEAWVLFDDQHIYVVCRCWDEHPERIVANDMRRDGANLFQHDHFAVEFDTFHDRRNGLLFYMTALGGMRDAAMTGEIPDVDWNTVWEGKASRFDRGWIAEMAFPFKSLRYAPGREQTWGIQFRRLIRSKNERAHITALSPAGGSTATSRMSEAATLVGLEVPPPALNFEVKPYAISRIATDRLSRPALSNDIQGDVGVDVKYGITKSLTADFTYNTDFAQVEADEAQVNLTRFNLSFPENREFFLEGQGIFAFAGGIAARDTVSGNTPRIFYSRRIGLSDTREVPVIGGGRFTGRAGPWGIGAFSLQTDENAAAGAARTNFTVLRLRRDVLRRSNVGVSSPTGPSPPSHRARMMSGVSTETLRSIGMCMSTPM